MVWLCNGEMVWWLNDEINPKWRNGEIVILWYRDIVIWCDSILLGQTCNTTHFISFSKHLENISESDFPDSRALKTHPESLTYKVIQLFRDNK